MFGFVLLANPTVLDGIWAELIDVYVVHATAMPRAVVLAEAGAAPLASISALDAFYALYLAEGTTDRPHREIAWPIR